MNKKKHFWKAIIQELTDEEKQAFSEAFAKFDKDGNGKIVTSVS